MKQTWCTSVWLGLVWLGLSSVVSLTNVHAESVQRVEVVGNKRIEDDALLLAIKSRAGEVSSTRVAEDIKTLFNLGYFDQVEAKLIDRDGQRILQYAVREKPVVRKVLIQGNEEVKEKDLAEALKLMPAQFYDRAKVIALQRDGVSLYQSKGYLDAEVSHRVVAGADNQVDVVFEVKEGKYFRIRRIDLKSSEELDTDAIGDVMQTKPYKWWSSWLFGTGKLNEEVLRNDLAGIRQYLLNHGYVEGAVTDPVVEKGDGDVFITIPVQRGPEYKVGAVKVSGDPLEGTDSSELMEKVKSKTGEVFSAEQIRNDSFSVSEAYSDKGYAFANVNSLTDVDKSLQLVNLDYQVSKGKMVTVDRINISGNEKTYDHVIRRELRIDEQELYSGSKVRRSEALLKRLGYFEEVSLTTKPGATDKQVDLDLRVREGSTGRFTIGAGYSTSDGALFNSSISEDNIFGTGRKLDLSVDYGTQRDNIILSLEDRRLMDSYLSGEIEGFKTDRRYLDFDRGTVGGGVGVGYPLEEIWGESFQDINAGLKYQYQDIEISDVDLDAAEFVKESEGNSTASSIIPRLFRNTIDNPLNPTKGSRQVLSLELAGLGGSEDYYVVEFKQTGYRSLAETPWGGDVIGSWRMTLGYGESNNGDKLPLFKRYFPGGINSVRGYKARTLGPKDENGNEYGGAKEFVNNFDLTLPLVNSAGIRAVIFYDIGEAFDDDQSIEFSKLRQAYGFGLRWASPMGPIRIEFGFPIARKDGEKPMVPMFSFGAPL